MTTTFYGDELIFNTKLVQFYMEIYRLLLRNDGICITVHGEYGWAVFFNVRVRRDRAAEFNIIHPGTQPGSSRPAGVLAAGPVPNACDAVLDADRTYTTCTCRRG